MTRDQLIARAAQLEDILDNSDELSLPDVEEELCQIYAYLNGEYL